MTPRPKAPAARDAAPIIIDKNVCEQVRVDLQEYKRHKLLSVRLFWRRDDLDPWKPSKRGFGLHVDALPELADGLRRLEAAAVARGWIEDTGEPLQEASTKRAPRPKGGPSISGGSTTRTREHLGTQDAALAPKGSTK